MARRGDAFRMSRSLLLGEEAGRFVAYERSISSVVSSCATTMFPGFSINPRRLFVTKPGPCKRRIISRHPASQLSTLWVTSARFSSHVVAGHRRQPGSTSVPISRNNSACSGPRASHTRKSPKAVSDVWPPDDRFGSCRMNTRPESRSRTSDQRSPLEL
jgi:hypothetical protein